MGLVATGLHDYTVTQTQYVTSVNRALRDNTLRCEIYVGYTRKLYKSLNLNIVFRIKAFACILYISLEC